MQPDGATCDATGKRKEYTPEYSGMLSADYVMPLGRGLELRSTLDLVFSDEYTFNPTLDSRSVQLSLLRDPLLRVLARHLRSVNTICTLPVRPQTARRAARDGVIPNKR